MRRAAVAILVVAAACGTAEPRSAAPAPPPTTTPLPTSAAPTTAVPPPPTTTTSTTSPAPIVEPVPAPLAAALDARLADPRLADVTVGASVWVEGYDEVVAVNPDLALLPASNQKLYTAMAALAVLGPDATLATEVLTTPAGDLVLVGGGDPTLTERGPHSLDALAVAVRAAGTTRVTGALVADGTAVAPGPADGWFDWHVPGYVAPVGALVVDRNGHRADAAYLADPLLGNLALFRAALARAGVAVDGPDVAGVAPPDARVTASLASPPVRSLVADMLRTSDNLVAEQLLRRVGTEVAAATVADLGVPLAGTAADGSGLSRLDRRSAREWRRLLQAAEDEPWAASLLEGLPVAGRTGTLAERLRGTAAEGNLRAKTGWILEGRALSGYLTTAGGREVVLSVIVNGEAPGPEVVGAIDALVTTLAADPS